MWNYLLDLVFSFSSYCCILNFRLCINYRKYIYVTVFLCILLIPASPPSFFLQRSQTQQKKKKKESVANNNLVSLIEIIIASISVLILASWSRVGCSTRSRKPTWRKMKEWRSNIHSVSTTGAASVKSNLKFPKPRLCCRVWANISYLRMSLSLTERRANLMASSKWSLRISGTGS